MHVMLCRMADMIPTDSKEDYYELLDSGYGRKLERFGPYVLSRPCAQAIWRPRSEGGLWEEAHAVFERRPGKGWQVTQDMPSEWRIVMEGLWFRLSRTDFGHVGVFPEQKRLWAWIREQVTAASHGRSGAVRVLNLFAYSGGATLASSVAGAEVCHLDASRGMVGWARLNARINGMEEARIRWIVDDARKFIEREVRRGRRYDAVILDPPTYGHGTGDEVFRIEDNLVELMTVCWALLSDSPLFVLLSSHTPVCTPTALENVMASTMPGALNGSFDAGEMLLEGGPGVLSVPSGTYCRWVAKAAPVPMRWMPGPG